MGTSPKGLSACFVVSSFWSPTMDNSMLGTNSPLKRRAQRRPAAGVELKSSKSPLSVSGFEIRGSESKPAAMKASLSGREEEIVSKLLAKEIDYIGSPEFSKRGAARRIYEEAPEITAPDVSWYRPLMSDTGSKAKVPSPPARKASVVLTQAEERVLFLKLNYARYQQAKIQTKLAGRKPTETVKKELLHWYNVAERYREQIAETNLALVLAMAKRVKLSDVDFADLVSEGNMALMRSVDKFDCERGFKFSTYACRAILKAFSRQGMKNTKYRQRFPAEFDSTLEKSDHLETLRATHERECADEVKHIVLNNNAGLSDVELSVLGLRFGITDDPEPKTQKALTLEQVGQIIGVTKERVRQIQNKAIKKIRSILDDPRPDIDRNISMPPNN